jgi:hypothetical protein
LSNKTKNSAKDITSPGLTWQKIIRIEARRSTVEKPSANLQIKLIRLCPRKRGLLVKYVPPKDSKNICDQEDEADEGRKSISVSLLHYLEALDDVAEAWAKYHTCKGLNQSSSCKLIK